MDKVEFLKDVVKDINENGGVKNLDAVILLTALNYDEHDNSFECDGGVLGDTDIILSLIFNLITDIAANDKCTIDDVFKKLQKMHVSYKQKLCNEK